MANRLHVITPASTQGLSSLITEGAVAVGDLVADFSRFPASVHEIQGGLLAQDITSRLSPPRDYWAVIRSWLVRFTEQTRLQDLLSIRGYGFWWTLNVLRFVPAVSELGNAFAWIDLLTAIRDQVHPALIVVYGRHDPVRRLVGEIWGDTESRVLFPPTSPAPPPPAPPRQIGLVAVRILFSVLYFLYTLFRRPEICFFSNTNLLRRTKDKMRDIYLGDVMDALRSRGWRTTVVEKYGANASWAGLGARGFCFPSDLFFLLSTPTLHKGGPGKQIVARWREKWATVQPDLMPHLRYRGCDLSPWLLPLLAREFTQQAPGLEIMVVLWRRILRLWRPRLVYVNNSYGRSACAAIIAAKTLGIPTIEQQHGTLNKQFHPYLVPRQLQTKTDYPLCDILIVWGEYMKRLLVDHGAYPPERVAVCGFPHIDTLLGDLPPKEATLAQLGIPAEATVVLYTSNAVAQGFRDAILDSIQQGPTTSSVYWIIKLHPRETSRAAWEESVAQRQLQTVRVLQHEIDFYALLAACDMHVSFTSTTLIEAAILGKLNLGLDVAQVPDPIGYAEAHAYLPVSPARLGSTVHDLLQDPERRARLLAEQRAFAQDWCLHDGQAVQRIVRVVESVIGGKRHGAH